MNQPARNIVPANFRVIKSYGDSKTRFCFYRRFYSSKKTIFSIIPYRIPPSRLRWRDGVNSDLSALTIDLNLGQLSTGLKTIFTVPIQYRNKPIISWYIDNGSQKINFLSISSDNEYIKSADYIMTTGVFSLERKDQYAYGDWSVHIVLLMK